VAGKVLISRFVIDQTVSTAILTRLWASGPVSGPDPSPVEVVETGADPALLPLESGRKVSTAASP
jgi:hypothetical protein